MKLSLILQAVDKITAPVKKAGKSMQDLAGKAGIKGVATALKQIDASRIGAIAAPAKRAAAGARELAGRRGLASVVGAMHAIDRAERRILGRGLVVRLNVLRLAAGQLARAGGHWALEKGAYGAGRAVGFTLRKVGMLSLRILQLGTGAALAGFGFLTSGVISQASKFEQFQVVLENTEGSAIKARKAMGWVKQFAQTTPYQVGDVMEAFVALKAYGIDPVDGSLRSLGNAASGMNKPIMQAVEMLADAQTGEFERLKEFGIVASKQGEKVTFTYRKAGKEIARTAKSSGGEIQKALIGILDDRFSGMMERQSLTLSGLWSNLMDQVSNFQLDIADAGFFDVVKGKLQQLLDWVNKLAKNGQLSKWADDISSRLSGLVEWSDKLINNTDWSKFGSDLSEVVDGVAGIASGFVELKKAGDQVADTLNQIQALLASIGRADPLNALQSKIGEAGTATNRWARQVLGFDNDRTPSSGLPPSRQRSKPELNRLWLAPPASRSPGSQGGRGPVPFGPRSPAARGRGPAPFAPQTSKSEVTIRLEGAGAKGARVSSLRSDGDTRVDVLTGRSMGGPA